MADRRNPAIGELWRSTWRIPMPKTSVPEGTMLLVVERSKDSCESRVIWDGGTGWVSDFCSFWERVDEAR
jgi:hypothetical protein